MFGTSVMFRIFDQVQGSFIVTTQGDRHLEGLVKSQLSNPPSCPHNILAGSTHRDVLGFGSRRDGASLLLA